MDYFVKEIFHLVNATKSVKYLQINFKKKYTGSNLYIEENYNSTERHKRT